MPTRTSVERTPPIESALCKQAAQIAHFRQLCALGLGGQVIMPELLRTLAEIVPYDASAFCWTDSRGLICNLWEECPARATSPPGLADLIPPDGVSWSAQVQGCEPHAHRLCVPVGNGARPAGMLLLGREIANRPFSVREQELLVRIAQYLHRGILTQRNQREPYADSGETGLVVLDECGAVRLTCVSGRRLLLQAACPLLGAGWRDAAATTCAIESLGVRIGQAFSGPAQCGMRLQNDWGLFELRPHRLVHGNGDTAGLGVRIGRHEPLALKLMRGMKNLDLSCRQKEVVLLLAFNYSHRAMALRMGVSYNTVVDHIRKIFSKVGVRDAHHLLATIMGRG